MIDETADAIILRWPKEQPVAQPARRQRFEWLSFAFWLARIAAEGVGWLAVIGLITRL